MKRNRHDRNKDFDTFYDKSEGIFKNLQQQIKEQKNLRENICYMYVPEVGMEGQISEL